MALKVPDSYNGYVELYVKITAVYDDVVMVKFTYKDNNYITNVSQYMGFYRIGKWDEPVAFVKLCSQSVTVRKYKDTTYLIISSDDSSTSNYRDKEYWVIQG